MLNISVEWCHKNSGDKMRELFIKMPFLSPGALPKK